MRKSVIRLPIKNHSKNVVFLISMFLLLFNFNLLITLSK
nr:MAG TPA: hypothetical protein [Caudoviricetes sp.]